MGFWLDSGAAFRLLSRPLAVSQIIAIELIY